MSVLGGKAEDICSFGAFPAFDPISDFGRVSTPRELPGDHGPNGVP